MLQIVEDVEAETVALRRWWAERRVDGVLLVDLRVEDPRVALVEELGLPAVIVGGPGPTGSVPLLPRGRCQRRVPNRRAPGMLGHRGSTGWQGLRTSLTRSCGHESSRKPWRGRSDRSGSCRLTTRARPARRRPGSSSPLRPVPTAIFYDSDLMAVSGLGTPRRWASSCRTSFRSPLSTILSYAGWCGPAHRVRQGHCGLWRAGRPRAHSLVEGRVVPTHVTEPPRLVARASTAPPPGLSQVRRRDA